MYTTVLFTKTFSWLCKYIEIVNTPTTLPIVEKKMDINYKIIYFILWLKQAIHFSQIYTSIMKCIYYLFNVFKIIKYNHTKTFKVGLFEQLWFEQERGRIEKNLILKMIQKEYTK